MKQLLEKRGDVQVRAIFGIEIAKILELELCCSLLLVYQGQALLQCCRSRPHRVRLKKVFVPALS